MPRFFVGPEQILGEGVLLDVEDRRHLAVLRLTPEETITVCDGEGTDYICRYTGGDAAEILARRPSTGEPSVDCTVYAAFSKGDRMDLVIQKSVELGAVRIVLFPSARCVARYEDKGLEKKLARWGKIALEAAKQSGRGRVPAVDAVSSFSEAVSDASTADTALFFYEDERQCGFREALEAGLPARRIALMTGPEGGFAPEEAALAREKMQLCSLGPRILRCETAPVAALAAIMFARGELS